MGNIIYSSSDNGLSINIILSGWLYMWSCNIIQIAQTTEKYLGIPKMRILILLIELYD